MKQTTKREAIAIKMGNGATGKKKMGAMKKRDTKRDELGQIQQEMGAGEMRRSEGCTPG